MISNALWAGIACLSMGACAGAQQVGDGRSARSPATPFAHGAPKPHDDATEQDAALLARATAIYAKDCKTGDADAC